MNPLLHISAHESINWLTVTFTDRVSNLRWKIRKRSYGKIEAETVDRSMAFYDYICGMRANHAAHAKKAA